jgi:SpoVK/Ycf46/Vps4 family AAA+-type ATPase
MFILLIENKKVIDWIKRKLNFIKENATIENVKSSEQNELTQSLIEITQLDFETAISRVQPSSKREGFATVPDVSWNDIGALQNVREELKIAVLVYFIFFLKYLII